MFKSKEIRELEDQLADLKLNHKLEIKSLKRQFEESISIRNHDYNELNGRHIRLKGDQVVAVSRLTEKHGLAVEHLTAVHDHRLAQLQDKIDGLQKLENSYQDNIALASDLTEQRTILQAEQKSFGEIKLAILKAREEGKELSKAEYQKGYADGLSDGLRKGSDLSQTDRQEFVNLANKAVDHHKPVTPAVAPPAQIVVVGSKEIHEKK